MSKERTELLAKLLELSDNLSDQQLMETLEKIKTISSVPDDCDPVVLKAGKFAWDTFRPNMDSAQARDLNTVAVAMAYNTLSFHYLVSRGMTKEECLKQAQAALDDVAFTMAPVSEEGQG